MKKAEIILVSVSGLTLILMALWVPVAMFFILAMASLSVLYMVFSFALLTGRGLSQSANVQTAPVSKGRLIGSIGAGFVFSMVVLGLLFGFMRWPGSRGMLLPTVLPLVLIGIISLIKISKAKDDFYKKMLIRVGVLGALTALFFTMPYFWLDLKYRDFPEYRAAVKAADAHPEDKALQQKEQEEYNKIFPPQE